MTDAEDFPSIAGLLREGVRSTFSDRGGLLRYGLLLTLALTTLWILDDLNALGDSSITATMSAEIMLVAMAFYWQRRYFVGSERDFWIPWNSDDEYRNISGLVLGYMLRAVLLFGTIAIAIFAVAFVLYRSFQHSIQGLEFADFGTLLALPVSAVLIIATARFLLVFPAYASGKRMGWLQSWTLCRGLGLRLGSRGPADLAAYGSGSGPVGPVPCLAVPGTGELCGQCCLHCADCGFASARLAGCAQRNGIHVQAAVRAGRPLRCQLITVTPRPVCQGISQSLHFQSAGSQDRENNDCNDCIESGLRRLLRHELVLSCGLPNGRPLPLPGRQSR